MRASTSQTRRTLLPCAHCGKAATDTYRSNEGTKAICGDCHDAMVGTEIERCENCAGWFAETLVTDCDALGIAMCTACHEGANELDSCGCFNSEPDFERDPTDGGWHA